jgi:hypothetical protein
VDDTDQAQQEPDQSSGDSRQGTETEQQSKAPKPTHKAKNYKEASKQFALRYVLHPLGKGVEWLDGHNGLVTALSTVAIAVLTYFVAVYANGQLGIFRSQLEEMRSTGKQTDDLIAVTKQSADAAKLAANAALTANATTRAQINASLIIQDAPTEPKIKIAPDGTITIDMYIVDIGQSWARDVYVNIGVTIRDGPKIVYAGPPIFAGESDIGPQTPSHLVLDDFEKFRVGEVNDTVMLSMTVRIAMAYTNIFDERIFRNVNLIAARGDINAPCCTLKEFQESVGLGRNADFSRIPSIPPK